MKYQIFIGAICYFCPQLKEDVVEMTLFVAADWTEAKEKNKKYAPEFANKINLSYEKFGIYVQAYRTDRIANAVHFVRTNGVGFKLPNSATKARRRLDREKIPLELNGENVIEI